MKTYGHKSKFANVDCAPKDGEGPDLHISPRLNLYTVPSYNAVDDMEYIKYKIRLTLVKLYGFSYDFVSLFFY